jgi:hypothetical protein
MTALFLTYILKLTRFMTAVTVQFYTVLENKTAYTGCKQTPGGDCPTSAHDSQFGALLFCAETIAAVRPDDLCKV